MSKHVHNVGTMLLEDGLLTEAQLEDALASQELSGMPLVSVLLDDGLVEEADLMRAVARRLGIEFVELTEASIDPAAASLVPENLRNRYGALPYAFEEGRLVVAMSDPGNVLAVDDIRAVSGRDVMIVTATRSDIDEASRRADRFDESVTDLADLAVGDGDVETEDIGSLESSAEEAPVVKLMNTIIARAVADRASDIHVEPGERDLRIRFRIDGVLHEIMTTSRSIANAVVSRVKIMADLDIAERRVPQDGRVSMRVGGRPIDLRVATLPSLYGEKVVMRILDKSSGVATLEELGFLPYNRERYKGAYTRPHGAILVTGPTGSGKTTTLYSTLNILNAPEVNIITVEDPVEYRLEGVTQIQVNRKAGLLFATVLKSILRADPDIILVGEVRDGETASIAVEAALTGHLVLSTLHTNDAASSINRLIDMGVEPFLVSSAIDAVLAQRLARVLCDKCKEEYTAGSEALELVGWDKDSLEDGLPSIYRAVGCKACSNTGYRGRVAINEVMLVGEQLQRMTVERRSSEDMRQVAIENGMRTLRQDGLAKVALGMTSIEEVLRVVV